MAHNIIDFFSYVPSLASGQVRYTNVPKNAFLCTMPAGSGLFVEVTICSSGSAVSTLSMSKWMLAWRYSSSGVISTVANDCLESMVDSVGSYPVTAVTADVGGTGGPRIRWRSTTLTKNYALKGQVWIESTS